MSIVARIGYFLLQAVCRAVASLPDWFLYHPLQDTIYFVVYKIIKYRVTVVRINLRNSFPDYTPEHRLEIERRFYRHLSELFVDTIDMVNISRKTLMKRVKFTGLEEHMATTQGQDWIAAMAHYGSWEYFTAYQQYDPSHCIAAIYRPLHSEVFEQFFTRFRTRLGSEVVPMASLMRYMIGRRNKIGSGKTILGMIADQVPPNFRHPRQFTFLNQPTSFFMGVEKMGIKFGMPIYFTEVRKTNRAHYELKFKMIYDGKEPIDEYRITERYIELLEKMIIEVPELWLWTHRRWKHNVQSQCL